MEETVKAKTATKLKEKRLAHSQDGAPKKIAKHQGLIKNDMPPLSPPRSFEGGSPVKKLLNEAGKIVKIGMEKDFALLERETTVQTSNETIDNLRKNILHLQMEYEKLDQNFQREVSYRTEITKRMDTTRELVESAVQCSNILAASVKQLEDDKFKIAELYEVIFQNQKELETKHAQAEKFIQEQDKSVKTKLEEIKEFHTKIVSQNSATISQLNNKLLFTNEKLKTTIDENEKLERKIQEIQESSNRVQMFLEQQEKINSLHKENMITFKINMKKLKIQRFKYQKLLKTKKKEFLAVITKNKNLKQNLEKMELLYKECISVNKALESRNNEWKSKLDQRLEDDARERERLEAQKQELVNQLTEKERELEDLKKQNEILSGKISELTTNEGAKRLELEQIQDDLSKMLSENLRLKENVTKLNEENKDKAKTISELEMKTSAADAGFNSQIEFYKKEVEKLENVVKNLGNQVSDLQKELGFEKSQKDSLVIDLNKKLGQTVKESNEKIADLKKQLEDKTRKIQVLESEKTHALLDGKTNLDTLSKELQQEKFRNNELNKNLESVEHNYEELRKQLEEAKCEITDKEEKLMELQSLNKTLYHTQNELERKAGSLKKEMELEKKSFGVLEEKYKKAEKELSKMQKTAEENASLKSANGDLRNALEATEARLEAYKVVVKKLETERVETKNSHSEEVSKLKSELSRLEETMRKEKPLFGTPQKNVDNTTKKEAEPSVKSKECFLSQKVNTKENEPEMGDIEKWQQTPPAQGGKKFLSTPRKVFTSTPQPNFRNITPIQKKRDPYEFDSDSSVERFDPEKVLKVFNRQRRGCTKKTKGAKIISFKLKKPAKTYCSFLWFVHLNITL